MPAPGEETLIYVCGPPGFMDLISGTKTLEADININTYIHTYIHTVMAITFARCVFKP